MQELELLRRKLSELKDRLDDSGVERTYHLRRIMGQNCKDYQRSLDLFTSEDYEEIRDRIIEIHDIVDVVEGRTPNE